MKEEIKSYYRDKQVKEKTKAHFEKYKTVYYCIGTGIVVAGATVLYMNRATPKSHDVNVHAGENAVVAGKNVVMSNVNFITSNRQGPPSWVIRCIETDQIFTSQNAAANEMGLPASEISRHLNGVIDNVKDYTFERICLAA